MSITNTAMRDSAEGISTQETDEENCCYDSEGYANKAISVQSEQDFHMSSFL